MATVTVADLEIDGRDALGVKIEIIYARKPPEYAVYRTANRLLIQFADLPERESAQRKALAPLNPLRGEINGLIDGWHTSKREGRKCKAKRYDRRVADAVVVAFEGDIDGAEVLLKEIKQAIIDERVALARFQYLTAAFVVGVISMLFLRFVGRYVVILGPGGLDLLHAGMTGAIGAFFSISLAIRGRTVLPDLQWVSNLMDAVLRMVIGLIGGGVLMAFVAARVVNISIGGTGISPTSTKHWLFVLIVGFIAGFSERFVPDLLDKAAASTDVKSTPERAESVKRKAAGEEKSREEPPAVAERPKDEEPLSEEAASETCTVGIDLPDHQVTSDAELPPASGGVEKPEAA